MAEAINSGQDSARKQGLVQKLDGDKGPKVFSLNTATKTVSVKTSETPVEEVKEEEPVVQENTVKTTTTKKTTITFTKEVPSAGTIIKVERANDKYLKFRDKGITANGK